MAHIARHDDDIRTVTIHPVAGHRADSAPGSEEEARERLRSTIPVLVSVVMLFGLVVGAALVAREVADLGVWLVSSR
ncbi:hypothetical protein [Cellulomonas bogoriensis]|uniref:Uncharacterized protein n=1 Tax=Cellulomonas bogoriensis 69B4 = DSM 16987 TaxID=1386082 RepID=A0A0A0BLX2_9CELL|nr:hypothetical protein [Cellulomonas bogoriensis]KGM08870.1 hypothetical protein N869_09485 [Cellulomonas bogoriensis 69B4 = DSM 16987]